MRCPCLASFVTDDRSKTGEQSRLSNPVDLRSMCILSKTDLNRIYNNLDRCQRDRDDVRQEVERKRDLAARSAELTKHWPNTILVRVDV
jgi:hypothetical protein